MILSPVCLLIALAILTTMGRPILFRQRRPGLHGKVFTLIKFRTMQPNQSNFGDDEARVTRLGQFLRRFSLDEFPQLWNVLRGEMSLVGPRPLLVDYLQLYSPYQARRNEVLPGLTGWSQVNGRNAASWENRLNMDVWYVENMSFWLDTKILVLTVAKAFTGKESCPATLLPGSEHLIDERIQREAKRAA
ncbi:MAG: sugar transferase [Pirellulales bacterium]|nr:sugar transferase [Pirellulales bacterium]